MGMLIEGKWSPDSARRDEKGRFLRSETVFRDRITADGSSEFKAEEGRYHLFVSLACPWAHRTLILRKLKGLETSVSASVVAPLMTEKGWEFPAGDGTIPKGLNGREFLWEVYLAARPDYTGRASVPVLWDKQRATIVNNESAEIARMLDTEFDGLGATGDLFYPEALRRKIDETIEAIYHPINNGVYRAGFAATQEAYGEAVGELFAALDHWEGVLETQRYLCGQEITEADWFLFTTLIRFDVVYYSHFKCNLRRIVDYPNLWNYLRELYQVPGVAETCDFDHIKRHYYWSHETINPTRIVPQGPIIDFGQPHDRARKKYA